MINSRSAVASIVAALIALAGCQSTAGPNEQQGVIIGGLLGGLLGKQIGRGHGQTAAIIVGSVVGSQIAGNIGRSMDDNDRLKTGHSLETVRTGVRTTWRNPDSGNAYTVTPTRTFEKSTGPCREYTVDAVIGGRAEKIYGTACRQADGSWKTVS